MEESSYSPLWNAQMILLCSCPLSLTRRPILSLMFLSHSTPQITSPTSRLCLRQHSLIYINQSVKTCTAGICLWWKVIESCTGVLKSAEPIPERFRYSWYLQKTYLLYGYNQALVYESYDRISERTFATESGQLQFHRCYHPHRYRHESSSLYSSPLNWREANRKYLLRNKPFWSDAKIHTIVVLIDLTIIFFWHPNVAHTLNTRKST